MPKIPKTPPPQQGDKVKLKGRDAQGILRTLQPENNWCWVDWDKDKTGAKIVHLFELERI